VPFALLFAGSFAAAQAPQMVRVRGTIESVDGQMLTVKSGDGATLNWSLRRSRIDEVGKAMIIRRPQMRYSRHSYRKRVCHWAALAKASGKSENAQPSQAQRCEPNAAFKS
jgi:hypothetical protein